LSTLCLLLGYTRQAFYNYKNAQLKQALEEELIIQEVLKHREIHPLLGTRKLMILLKIFLNDHMISIGRDALFQLLDHHNLLIRKRQRKTKTTFSRHHFKKHPNLIKEFVPLAPNRLWASDITFLGYADKFGYLSLVTDVYSKKIVGFHVSQTLEATGCVQALQMALKTDRNLSNLIHHSDRGSQYCCHEYIRILRKKNISISMTQNGDPRENAVAERVNGILKIEYLLERYDSFKETQHRVSRAITIYNSLRPHSSCDMKTPNEAHELTGELKKHWRNYYDKKEVVMSP
jgi:putative transposase